MKYFLDTNICIWLLSGKNQRVIDQYRSTPFEDMVLPSVVAAELLYGANKSVKKEQSLARMREFIRQFEIIGFNDSAIEIYGEIRAELEKKGTPIGANDYFIAAIAKANGGILVTNNTKEFNRISDLVLEDWTQ